MRGAQADQAARAAQRGAGKLGRAAASRWEEGLPAPFPGSGSSGPQLRAGGSRGQPLVGHSRPQGPATSSVATGLGLRVPGGEPPLVRDAPCLARREMASNTSTLFGSLFAPTPGTGAQGWGGGRWVCGLLWPKWEGQTGTEVEGAVCRCPLGGALGPASWRASRRRPGSHGGLFLGPLLQAG